MSEQINNGNYVKIASINEARKTNQLHFVGYNFVVSATSSSTKVRMTTDSSMRTQTGLSLNEVTQPAPGDVPSLQGILIRSRCHPHYAVYDIKKFFRSVRTSEQDSFLRIVCIPANSFSSPPPLRPPGISTVTELFLSVTAPPVTTPPVPRWQPSKLSSKTPLQTSNLLSFKLYWRTRTLMTEVSEPIPLTRSPLSRTKLGKFYAKVDLALNPGNAPVKTELANTLA